ncbi:hypothetical protein, partial [Kitasatospora nipponensis]
MKLSKRATGALLLAVGSGVLAGQSAAMAAPGNAPVTPGQVATIEEEWGTEEVPFTIPLETVSEHLPLLPKGGQV